MATAIDIMLLIALFWYGVSGFKNGLIYELISILALVLGCWMAYHFSDGIATLITGTQLIRPIAMILTFTIVMVLVNMAGKVVHKIIKFAIPDVVDRLFGLLFGIVKVLVVSSVIFYILQDIDPREILLKKETKEQSFAYKYTEPIVPHALGWDLTNKQLNLSL